MLWGLVAGLLCIAGDIISLVVETVVKLATFAALPAYVVVG